MDGTGRPRPLVEENGRPVATPEAIAVGQPFTVGRTTLRVVAG